MLEFRNVSFQYPGGKDVLRDVSFELEKGKAYALVGPTGGGKTTTASLMARLYDPTEGSVFLDGRDIRSVAPEDRSRKVGFIPQEPFLFTGTVRENIVYGNDDYQDYSSQTKAFTGMLVYRRVLVGLIPDTARPDAPRSAGSARQGRSAR